MGGGGGGSKTLCAVVEISRVLLTLHEEKKKICHDRVLPVIERITS